MQPFSRDIKGFWFVATRGKEYGIMSGQKCFQGDMNADSGPGNKPDPFFQDPVDFLIQKRPWQSEFRDSVSQHAAGFRECLINGDRSTHAGEIMGRGETGRA